MNLNTAIDLIKGDMQALSDHEFDPEGLFRVANFQQQNRHDPDDIRKFSDIPQEHLIVYWLIASEKEALARIIKQLSAVVFKGYQHLRKYINYKDVETQRLLIDNGLLLFLKNNNFAVANPEDGTIYYTTNETNFFLPIGRVKEEMRRRKYELVTGE